MIKRILRIETLLPTMFFAISIYMFNLPFYGFLGVSEIPGFAAIFEHKILVAGNTFVFLSNPIVFILAILFFLVSIWMKNVPLKIRLVGTILPLLLIELGKWEFLLRLYENSVRSTLYGFWVHLAFGIIAALVTAFLSLKHMVLGSKGILTPTS